MKIITCHLISFGKFQDKKIEFCKGLNIIHGLNESGKTTIYNFIYGMFYGFIRPYRKRRVYLQEYEQYKPLFSNTYEGQIIFEKDGKRYILYRDFKNNTFDILDYLTGKSITEKLPNFSFSELDYPGNYFFQIPADVFKNTITIDKNWTHITKSSVSSLSDYLMNSSQGTESLDIRKSLDHLMEEKNKIGQRKSKTKPYGILLNRLEVVESQLTHLNEDVIKYKSSLNKKIKIENDIEDINIRLKKIKEKEIYDQYFYLEKRLEQKEEVEKELVYLKNKLNDFQKVRNFSKEEIEEILAIERDLEGLEERLLYLTENKNNLYRNINLYREQILKARDFEFYKKDLEKFKLYKNSLEKFSKLLFTSDLLFILISFITYERISKAIYFVILLLTLFSILATLIFFFFKKRNQVKIMELRNKLEKEFNISKDIPLKDFLDNELQTDQYSNLKEELIILEKKLKLVDEEIEETIEKEEFLINQKNKKFQLENIFNNNFNLTSVLKEIEIIEEQIQDKEKFYSELSNDDYSILKYELKNRELNWENIDVFKKEELEADLQSKREDLSRINERIYILEKSFHEKNILEEEYLNLKNEKLQWEEKMEALDLAISEINKSRSHLQRNFIPRFNKKLTEVFQFITNSKDQILLDEDFNLRLSKNGEFLESLHISSGTELLLILLLKIELVEEISSQNSLLIFDDAFLEVDHNRLLKVLLFLEELSYDYQILLFTNQLRELEIADRQRMRYQLITLGD